MTSLRSDGRITFRDDANGSSRTSLGTGEGRVKASHKRRLADDSAGTEVPGKRGSGHTAFKKTKTSQPVLTTFTTTQSNTTARNARGIRSLRCFLHISVPAFPTKGGDDLDPSTSEPSAFSDFVGCMHRIRNAPRTALDTRTRCIPPVANPPCARTVSGFLRHPCLTTTDMRHRCWTREESLSSVPPHSRLSASTQGGARLSTSGCALKARWDSAGGIGSFAETEPAAQVNSFFEWKESLRKSRLGRVLVCTLQYTPIVLYCVSNHSLSQLTVKILFCENEMMGWGHARSNASLLIAARHRYPEATLICYATKKHQAGMRLNVGEGLGHMLDSVKFETMPSPRMVRINFLPVVSSLLNIVTVYLNTIGRIWRTQSLARRHECDVIFFLSGSGLHIRTAKFLNILRRQYQPMVFIVHNWVSSNPRWLTRLLFPSSWSATNTPCRAECRYVLLHGGMRKYLERSHGTQLGSRFVDFWYPIIFGFHSQDREAPRTGIRFDFLSPSHKGVDVFCEYVAACNSRLEDETPARDVSFGVIGGYTSSRQVEVAEKLQRVGVTRFPRDYLSIAEFSEELRRATYLVHLFDPTLFECRFSSAIQDGIAWRVPALFLRNNYSRHLFDDLGTPGWEVCSLEEAVEITVSLIKEFSRAKYLREVDDVDAVRSRYSLDNAAQQVGAIIEELLPEERPDSSKASFAELESAFN